ncbi:hypothetical protein E4J93_06765 [Collinsella sp. BA40]|uniref:hypothetical protein n=1 Tax=Collinsella sp. BA40 TaxID=2560852 RepID=UPI0011C9EBFF|nr:hypothetical protein [Collinsella sp. BA40]TXF35486.1 hypothetical protein E4J93_06765 [Collinsella sp. BA40]
MKIGFVGKEALLGIAGAVWCIAGFNIVRLGILAYLEQSWPLIMLLVAGSIAVFAVFWTKVFSKMLAKHVDRILAYADPQPFWRFFDRQAFIIMAIMMTVGISLRAFSLVPSWFIAFFYTGLGVALTGAGVGFLVECVRAVGERRA